MTLEELPEVPVGWTRLPTTFIDFGGGAGGIFEIFDDKGRKVEGIGYSYSTHGQQVVRGFSLNVGPTPASNLSWPRLRELYAEWRAGLAK